MTHGDGRVCCALCIEYVPPSDAVAVEIPDDDGDSDTTGICRRCAELVRDALDA